MGHEPPDMHFLSDLQELNRAFLNLIRHPEATAESWRLLELEPGVAAALRLLEPEALAFIAGLPGLLAGLAPASDGRVADPAAPHLATGWLRSMAVYAAMLQTYLWQTARQDPLLARLCLGLGDGAPAQPGMLIEFTAPSADGAVRLRARFGRHPRLWPQLLRAARQRDRGLRELCRLELLALGARA